MKIKAIYKNNVLKPLEKLDLKEGEEVEIEVKEKRDIKSLRGSLKIDSRVVDKIVEDESWVSL
ncbi:MAG: DUF104 domain-containing protein [Methanomicrobia archaeon]|nr:DUF104 domain-containing protein [Methanomicrobia archaeon]